MRKLGMMGTIGFAACLSLAAVASAAQAQETYFYATPWVGTSFFTGDFGEELSAGTLTTGQAKLNPAPSFGLYLGTRIGGRLGVEGSLSASPTTFLLPISGDPSLAGREFGDDVTVLTYSGNLAYVFTTSKTAVAPFLTAGAGGVTVSPDTGDSETELLINFGAGLDIPIRETVLFRLDLRDYLFPLEGDFATGTSADDGEDQNINTIQLTAGVTFRT